MAQPTDYEKYIRTDELLSLQKSTEALSCHDELQFQVGVKYVGNDPGFHVRCGPLLGLKFPKRGPVPGDKLLMELAGEGRLIGVKHAVTELDGFARLASAAGGTERTGGRLECVACGVGLPDELQRVAARGFMVVAQDFQDEWTLDVGKLRKCCVGEIVPDGRIIPFCAYNAAGYRAQVRADLAAGASA